MEHSRTNVTYQGFRVAAGWEVVVARSGQPLRLLDLPVPPETWSLRILTDYLADPARAADLSEDFSALTVGQFTEDWTLTASNIEAAISEIELLRAKCRMALMRG